MEANNKREFFQLLTLELNRVGIDDTAEIAADFEEHFANSAANGLSEAEACHRLGDIKEIARNYLNLESSRINSMVARDVERKRISLTKPGRSVPADLSLMNARDAANSDNVRSYTPDHISPEIYPNQSSTVPNSSNVNMNGGYNSNQQNINFGGQSTNTNNTSNASTNQNAAAQNAANQSVADALSDAGKAIADAAKVTGHAIADAFSNSGVKDAVIGAGQSAANAVKTAGQSAADAVSRAKSEHGQRHNQNRQSYGVPRPNDEFRENNNQNNTGSIPRQTGKAKNTKGGFKFVDVSMLKPNVNTGKLVGVILLDIFLWDWLIPTMVAIVISFFAVAAKCVFWNSFKGLFSGFNTVFPTNFFLFTGFVALGLALVCIAVWTAKLLARLVVFVINTHIRAIYDI
ncbi:MAG: DUF1700 domain-containing protein [Oscillospiraceae bacterium]|nr:DUF1700 domain-containing protein [Oscillospiraceae bacterium]